MNPTFGNKADIALMAAVLCGPPMRRTRDFELHPEFGFSPIEIPGIQYRTPITSPSAVARAKGRNHYRKPS